MQARLLSEPDREPGVPCPHCGVWDSRSRLRSRTLSTLTLVVAAERTLGRTAAGTRWSFGFAGGTMRGRVGGVVLPSGGGTALRDADGNIRLDARCLAELEDGSLLWIVAQGWVAALLHAPRAGAADGSADPPRPRRRDRLALRLDTASRRYGWLNRTVAVAIGGPTAQGATYEVHEVF